MADEKTNSESGLWLNVGIGFILGGAIFMGMALYTKAPMEGVKPLELSFGLAGAFLMLTGVAFATTSRIIAAMERGTSSPAITHRNVAFVLGAIGAAIMITAGYRSLAVGVPSLKQIALGIAGAMVAMCGVLHMCSSRIMAQIKDGASKEKAQGASA